MIRKELSSGNINLQGGHNRKINPYVTDEGYYKLQGFHLDEAGALTKWQGFNKFNNDQILESATPSPFTGIFQYSKADQTKLYLATALEGVYLHDDPVRDEWNIATTPATRTGTVDNLSDFAIVNDIACLCNGVDGNLKTTDGKTYYNLGIAAPSTAPTAATGGAGALTGAYSYKITFYNSTLGHESNPSSASNTYTASSEQISLTSIPVSTDFQVNKRRIYRTATGGAVWLWLTDINDNTTTSYTDNAADSTLSTAVEQFANGVPPTAAFWELYKGYLFLCGANSSDVYFTTQNKPNAVNSNDFRSLDKSDGDVVRGLKRLFDYLVAFKDGSIWNGYGDDRTNFTFVRQVSDIGTRTHHGIVEVPGQNRFIFPVEGEDFYTYNGAVADPVGTDIQAVIRNINKSKLDKVYGGVYKPKSVCYWVAPLNSSSEGDTLITYDYLFDKWKTRDISNTKANVTALLEDDTGRTKFYLGGYSGYSWEGDTGFADDSAEISCEAITRALPRNDQMPDNVKSFYRFMVWFKPQTGVTATISYALDDPESTYFDIGTIDMSLANGQDFVRFNAQGRRIYMRIYNSGTTEPVTIRGWKLFYKDLGRVV